jgi:HlyD family secretion protein
MTKWITIILALIGLGIGLYAVSTAREPLPNPPPARPPSVNPYPRGVAALGVVEASTRNVAVVAPEPGLVMHVDVQVNDSVQAGQPLFELDTRPLESQLVQARAAHEAAAAQVRRLAAMPRAEDLPPLEAAVARARAQAADAHDLQAITEQASRSGGSTATELSRRQFAAQAADAALAAAEADLAKARAGAWSEDIGIARAALDQAQAQIDAIRIMLDRLTVKAPVAGTVLKRNIEPGEYAASSGQGAGSGGAMMGTDMGAAIIVGDISTLHIRAQVDEEDAPQLRPGQPATARIRGQVARDVPLTMLRIEPLAAPKTQLLGTRTERVDTRVVEVVFRVEGKDLSGLYPGQAVDVFIDTAQH